MIYNKCIMSFVNSLGKILVGWRFAHFSQRVFAPYAKRYNYWEN
jgi:hypothetical protein